MKVLFVSRGNEKSIYGVSSFVYEQAYGLKSKSVEVKFFIIKAKGVFGYLKAAQGLKNYLLKNSFDIIHAHYLYSGIVAILQRKMPIIVSFIGCDINVPLNRIVARYTIRNKASSIIFVSKKLQELSKIQRVSFILPYGVDLDKYYPIDQNLAKSYLKWDGSSINILFSSQFNRLEKNAQLAFEAIRILKSRGIDCNLIEFKNIKSAELVYYYNACDLFLLTSLREGSPQSLKEAMACSKPAVLTDVGDVKEVVGDCKGYIITTFNPDQVADSIESILKENLKVTSGRARLSSLGYDINSITDRLIDIYQNILKT